MAAVVSELEQLCTGCARCCSGAMFTATPLDGAEELRFKTPALPQPCPFLQPDKRCGTYSSRPKACAEYLCPAAKALQRGEVSLEVARAALAVHAPKHG